MKRNNAFCLLILTLPALAFFGPPLFRGQSLAYRDSARFYYRQFEWNKSQWQRGEVPVWNAQENLGAPVVAEATSSVFYPMQLLFHVPGISFPTAFNLYAAIHVYLAAVGAFCLAKVLGCRQVSSLFAGISYSMSGGLVFQTCNIVFLVGGCWLPFCLGMSYLLARRPGFGKAGALALFLALPVLGGDPQTAYHVGIMSGVLFFWKFWQSRRLENRAKQKKSLLKKSLLKKSLWLHIVAAILAFGLSAIQILPSWNATRKSSRSYTGQARSIWEWGAHGFSFESIVGPPRTGTHHDHLYQFSQTPWSVLGLLWPNVEGEIVGPNDRWSESLPASDRAWTTSLYCGLLTISLFLSSMMRRSRRTSVRWLKSGFLLFAIGSLGWFGLGWMIHGLGKNLFGVDPVNSSMGAPTGGIYWFFVVFLPGYVNFRYPAKLFVVATLLLCLLAAREFEWLTWRAQFVRAKRYLLGLFWISLGLLVTLWLSSIPINRWLEHTAQVTTTECGPFSPQDAWSTVIWALLHTLLFSTAAVALINQGLPKKSLPVALLILTILDLTLANQRLVITARTSLWNRPRLVEPNIENDGNRLVRIFRTDSMVWSTKNDWLQKYESNRLEQIVDFEVQTFMPRHHLVENVGVQKIGLIKSFRTLDDLQFETLFALIRGFPSIRTNDSFDVPIAPNPVALGVLGCRYLLIPNWGRPSLPPDMVAVESKHLGALFVENPYYLPRLRITSAIKTIPMIEDHVAWLSDPDNRKMILQETRFGKSDLPDLVETNQPLPGVVKNKRQAEPDSQIKVLRETNTLIELEISRPQGMLLIADQFDPDWRAYHVDAEGSRSELDILRANLIMRGIPLNEFQAVSPRSVRILLVYQPFGLKWGAWISVLTITGLALAGVYMTFIRRPK